MNLQDLQALLDYHYWARDRLLDAAERLPAEEFTKPLGSSFASIRDTIVHLYSADWIWCSRWEGAAPAAMLPSESFGDVASIRSAWIAHERRVRLIVETRGAEGIQQPLEYRTLTGQPQAQVFWQQCQHLVNHGSYHRGQVTTMLRQLGAPPPKSMDLISFYRERAAASA